LESESIQTLSNGFSGGPEPIKLFLIGTTLANRVWQWPMEALGFGDHKWADLFGT
jgi:hypothetical protein